jgi:hypothetical protein
MERDKKKKKKRLSVRYTHTLKEGVFAEKIPKTPMNAIFGCQSTRNVA